MTSASIRYGFLSPVSTPPTSLRVPKMHGHLYPFLTALFFTADLSLCLLLVFTWAFRRELRRTMCSMVHVQLETCTSILHI